MRGVTRVDAAVAVGFVLAAIVEAVIVRPAPRGLLAVGVSGALVLGVLAVRRARPVLTLGVITAFGVVGTAVQAARWPDADDTGGVWIFALMLACYSLGAHGRGRVLVLGGLLPLLVVVAVDLPDMHGWELASGILFVTGFVGVLPTVVGRLVRVRRDRLVALGAQRERIVHEQRAASESAVLAERLSATERLRPALLDGLRELASSAESGTDPGQVETAARDLLGRTRAEVLALAAPVEPTVSTRPAQVDHVQVLRVAAQRWCVLGAGAIGAGMVLEATGTGASEAPGWLAVLLGVGVAVPLALVWWRPLAAVGVAWCAAAAFSQLIAPLDGTLSGTALALSTAFAVAALSTRRAAVAGLLVCWLGQRVAVGTTGDWLGGAAIVLVCWLGGLLLNEASALVERGRANNRLLADQDAVAAQRAVVAERLRLAREIHDQVGHSLTVVALQAGAARRLAAGDPDLRRALMRTVATAAREGMVALEPDAPGGTAADLASLLALTRTAGLTIRAEIHDLAELDPAGRSVVHRVVQEALTNALRHAPGAEVDVRVVSEDHRVLVTVANSAPSGPGTGPGTGRGLPGLRERVAAHSGSVEWGPRPDGGFEVRAVLPEARLEEAAR